MFNKIINIGKKRRHHFINDILNIIHPRSWWPGNLKKVTRINKAFYINLEGRCDRKKNIELQLMKIGIQAERIPAVNIKGEDDLSKYYSEYSSKERSEFLKNNINGPYGYIGCYLSHLNAISKCSNDNSYSLIVEDDLVISSRNFLRVIDNYIDQIDFDILLLDPQGDYCRDDILNRNVYKISKNSPVYFGSHAYLLKNYSKQTVLSALEMLPLDSPDHSFINARNKIKIYALRTSLCWPKGSFGSDMMN